MVYCCFPEVTDVLIDPVIANVLHVYKMFPNYRPLVNQAIPKGYQIKKVPDEPTP